MSFDRDRHSIISSSKSQASSVDPPNPNRNYNKSLINSAVTSNNMDDEEIARQEQEQLFNSGYMDVAEPSPSIDTTRLEEIDTDAAIARQLQEEEYSKPSILPFRPYQQESNDEKSSPITTDPYGGLVFSDAELAAQLQADEERNQRRRRQRPPFPSQRRPSNPTNNQNDEPETIPFPFLPRPTHQHSSSSGNNRNNNNAASLFRLFAGFQRPGGQGSQNLQNNDEDFGPDDYENLLALDTSVKNKALTTEQINRLPTEQFRRPKNQNDEENKCHICWDQFEQNQTLRRLRCLHLYHKDCIDPWLKTKNDCPICRLPTIE